LFIGRLPAPRLGSGGIMIMVARGKKKEKERQIRHQS
jgi:hypothetical protein